MRNSYPGEVSFVAKLTAAALTGHEDDTSTKMTQGPPMKWRLLDPLLTVAAACSVDAPNVPHLDPWLAGPNQRTRRGFPFAMHSRRL